MFRSLTFAGAAVAALAANVALSAGPRGEIITEAAAARHGLTRAWFTQVQMDVGRSRVESVVLDDDTLVVQTNRGMIQAINAETGQTLWSKQVGKPNHPTMTPGVSPDLVVVLNGSRLFALNRANGDLLYETLVSGPPGAGPGVSAKRAFVPMLNGMVVAYRLESMTDPLKELGKLPESAKPAAKSKEAEKPAEEAPEMSAEDRAAAEKARRENIRLRQEFIPPLSCQSAGHAVVQPLVLTQDEKDEYVCWVTDRGHLNVAYIRLLLQDMLSVAYRMDLAKGVVMRPAYSPPDARIGGDSGVLFAASNDGFVHADLRARRRLDVALRGRRADRRGPHARRHVALRPAATGRPVLPRRQGRHATLVRPGRRPVRSRQQGAGLRRRQVRADANPQRQDRRAVGQSAVPNLPIRVANHQTDRIYLVSETGLVQCLREVEAVKPLVYRDVREEAGQTGGSQAEGRRRTRSRRGEETGRQETRRQGRARRGTGGRRPLRRGRRRRGKAQAAGRQTQDPRRQAQDRAGRAQA